MLTRYHAALTRQALGERFSPEALEEVVRANLAQDGLCGQVGHDEYHFDNNAFAQAGAYMDAQRALIQDALAAGQGGLARAAFGRLIHAAQDFYAHSNYVDLWLSRAGSPHPGPAAIDALDEVLLSSVDLRSGRLYYPFEALSFLPGLKRLALPLLPRDSHAWMNLDAPSQGPKFAYAFEAALQRTRLEYARASAGLTPDDLRLFRGQGK